MIPGALESNLVETSGAGRIGTTLTGGIAHTKGTPPTQLIASTAAEAQGVYVMARGVSTAATDTGVLLDIMIGAALSETVLIPDIDCGEAHTNSLGVIHYFPVQIAAGTRISARLQGTQAAETADVAVWLAESCQHVEDVAGWVAYGEDAAASRGVSVTPATDTWGTWTEIGTTTADHNVFRVGVDLLGDTNVTARDDLIQIGYGASAPGAGGTAIVGNFALKVLGGEDMIGVGPTSAVYAVVASGTKVWARIASGGTEARGVIIYGALGTVVAGSAGIIGGRGHRAGVAR